MSVLTANNSLLDYEARTKSHSRHMRNYLKISQSNLDDAAIISYLKSRNFTKTLGTFLLQSNTKKTIAPIMEIFLRDGKDFGGNIQQYWSTIRQASMKNIETFTANQIHERKTKLIKLEFFMYIWYCIGDNEMNSTRIGTLKKFIQTKGQILSEIPQLLAYFSLSYVDKKVMSPIMKKICSGSWKNEVKILLEELIGVEADSMEQQWFNIIVDMIEICQQLAKNIRIETSSHNLKAMLERVSLYKTVVEKNKIEHKNQLTKDKEYQKPGIQIETALNMNNVKEIKKVLLDLNQSLTLNKQGTSITSILKVYNNIQQQIYNKSLINLDKMYVNQLITYDIFFLELNSIQLYVQYEWLKLLLIMSSYHKCRNYLVQNRHIITKLVQFIESTYSDHHTRLRIELLQIGFGVLQRIMIRQQLFEEINKKDIIYTLAVSFIKQFESDFQKNQEISNLYELVLAWILSVVIHRKGRDKISKTHIFSTLVSLLKRFSKSDSFLSKQSLISSILYLLLAQPHIRMAALKLNLKDILLNRMIAKDNDGYDTIVKYIIERIERNDDEEELDSDEDIEKDEQYDDNITISKEVVILCRNEGTSAQINEKIVNRSEVTNIRNANTNKQDGYARERYSWKKKWQKQ